MKKAAMLLSACLFASVASAQSDVTRYFLTNAGFDSGLNYKSGETTSVAQELKEIEGWSSELSANYTISGIYEFGFKGVFNTASVPSKGYDDEAGGCLAFSTGWDQTFKFYQDVTLPAGTYTIKAPTYNGSSVAAATSLLAWVPASGAGVSSTLTSFKVNAWTVDQISFTLTKTTSGRIQVGMKAASGGSANSAKLCVDYVQILATDMAVDKSALLSEIGTANKCYGDGTGKGAAELKTAIDAAQAVYDSESADMGGVLDATEAIRTAIDAYRKQNVSEDNPLDCTSYIFNPSFENGTNGWTVESLVSQSNSSFTKKSGANYLEKWTGSGSVGDGSVVQTVKDLPNGIYRLTVAAQNLSQSSATKKNTGAYIFADDVQEPVYLANDYSVKFTNIAGQVKIGFVAEAAGGNWISVDNFRLHLIGEMNTEVLLAELSRLVEAAKALQTKMQSAATADELKKCVDAVEKVIGGESEYASSLALNLQAAMTVSKASIAEFAALLTAIGAAEAMYDEAKEGASAFKEVIDEAKQIVSDSASSSDKLAAEIAALDKALLAFNIANATAGSGTAPKVTVTYKYVATGATEALVRATATGSNILERGVCWSTEHNPTVLDERTTKSFSQNGYIFHIKGLKPATVYYVRPYVMNKTYTVAYGDEVKIVTHPKGNCVGTWDGGAPDDAANTRCRNAINETIEYFNQWTGIKGFTLSGHYGSGTPTADCSYGGWMRIGPNAGNQAIGTVIHETGHGVGVGTSARWADKNVHNWKWLGREANQIYSFLENKEADPYNSDFCMVGDGTHGWGASASYDWFVNGADKDKHSELQYIGGCCLLYGLFIDGLCPTSSYSNGIAGYTYNFDDAKKYYLMSKDKARGLGEGVLAQTGSTTLGWTNCLADAELSDSAAWYIAYEPTTGLYNFRNASTGKFITHAASGTSITLKTIASGTPSVNETFQLMPDRTNVSLGSGSNKVTTHGYWFTWNNKSMSAGAMSSVRGYGSVTQAAFDYQDSATAQQWIIISEDEIEAYRNIAIATGIGNITADKAAGGETKVTGIYTVSGVQLNEAQPGLNIIRYSDGTSRKVMVK